MLLKLLYRVKRPAFNEAVGPRTDRSSRGVGATCWRQLPSASKRYAAFQRVERTPGLSPDTQCVTTVLFGLADAQMSAEAELVCKCRSGLCFTASSTRPEAQEVDSYSGV